MEKYREAVVKLLGTRARRVVAMILVLAVVLVSVPTVILPFLSARANETGANETVSGTDSLTEPLVTASDAGSMRLAGNVPMLLASGQTELSVSGVWDIGDTEQGHENIAFGSDDTATIEHGDDYQSEEVNVRVAATFPANATDRKLKIELAEGLEWVSNGENSILASALNSVGSQQGKSKIYGHYLNNGSYTYSFNEGVESASVTIRVRKTSATNFASITDSIKATATCTESGETLSATSALKKLECEQFSYINYVNSRLDKTVKAEEIAYNYGFVLHSYYSGSGISHSRLYDYAEITVTAPKGVKLNDPNVNHSGSGGISDVVVNGWKIVSTDDSADDVTKYTVRVDGFYNQAIGSTFEWIFPEELAGQTVLIEYSDITWKLYGDDTIHTLPKKRTRETYYTVISSKVINEIVESKDIFADLAFDPASPEAVYLLGGFPICNLGSDDSVPKVVEFKFDDVNIGVTNVTLLLPASGKTTVKVWYKVHGDDTWHEKSVTKQMYSNESVTSLGLFQLTNLDLGLSADTYLSALKYEYDYLVDDNGTPNDTTDDVRRGIPANRKPGGYSNAAGAFFPIAGVNLGLSAANPKAISTVTISDKYDNGMHEPLTYTITTTYGEKTESYMYLAGEKVWDEKAGNSFTVTADIKARWNSNSSAAYTVGFTHYPIIYIRDETGEGISNIRLVNSKGVDIIAEYSDNITVTLDHTETVDHNGDGKYAKVYKIDTTGLSSLSAKEDRYAAAVGAWDTTATKTSLTLSYTIYTPGTYDDGGVAHKLFESIFLSDPLMSGRSIKSGETRTDPYDVDGDGIITGERDIMQALNQKNSLTSEYTISPSADISIATAAKKADGSDYITWDGSADYVQIQSGEVYDVRSSIYNGAGVTTSTEDGKKTIVYIPIPKKGDQWGQANSGVDKDGNALSVFAYDMVLSGAVSNPDPDTFTISYGTVDTSDFNAGNSIAGVGQTITTGATVWSASPSDSTNCVRIVVSGMEPSQAAADAIPFILALVADKNANNREVNIFSAIFYEDITNANGDNYKLWKGADRIALQIAEGEVSGRIWIDANGNGLQDEGEKGLANVSVTLAGDENYTDTTDANGEYSFAKLALGNYTVSFTPDLDTYAVSEKDAGGDSLDSDAVLSGTTAKITGIVIPSTDSLGKQTFVFENLDAGLVPYMNITCIWSGDIPTAAVLPTGEKCLAGKRYTAPTIAAVKGYTFDGWYTDAALGNKYIDGTVLTEDITLYGEWTINSYDVTYQWNGAPSGAKLPETETVDYNTKYTAEMPTAVTGYTFDGWYTDEALTARFTDGTAIENDTDLYGEWTLNSYTVKLDANGGEGTMADLSVDYGEEIALPENSFTREGYQFIGWSTDNAATEAMYEDKATVKNLTAENGETVTLYAVWLKELTVTASASEGGTVSPETATVLSGDDLELTITTESGYYLKAITINGKSADLANLSESNGVGTFTLEALTEDTEVQLTFAAQPTIAVCSIDMGDEFWETDTITFTANGYWMTPREGAVKYVPTNWHHADPSGDWDGKDDSGFAYTDSFKQPKGEYTLKVEFTKYVCTSGTWVESGTETLTHDYIVKAKKPSGGSADDPKTGDSYVGMVIALNLLLLAALAVAYVAHDRRKQRASQK